MRILMGGTYEFPIQYIWASAMLKLPLGYLSIIK